MIDIFTKENATKSHRMQKNQTFWISSASNFETFRRHSTNSLGKRGEGEFFLKRTKVKLNARKRERFKGRRKKNYSVIRVIRDRFNPERVKRGENDS